MQNIKAVQILKSSSALADFVRTSETYRKQFSESLRIALSEKDDQKNTIFELG